MKLSEELSWRGFTNQTTLPDLEVLDRQKFTLYFGVDPSSDSMQVGNLAAAMMVRHFLAYGHKVFLLVGGATGMIGDPGGKSQERNLQTIEQIEHNKQAIAAQYETIFAGQDFTVVDNYDWLSKLTLLDFLRDTGKHFSMTNLLQRDFIASRIGVGGRGISYTEFSYTLLQGYDYYHLNQNHGVNLQVCGSDQWGNSISGVELIRRKTGNEAHVYSCPLVINKATGKKFGKSEAGTVWLDSTKTSAYQFYQFWLNSDDDGVCDYLRYFTMLTKQEIEKIEIDFNQKPSERHAQKTLAYEVTKLVHGSAKADAIRRVAEILFGSKRYQELTKTDFELLAGELVHAEATVGEDLILLLARTSLASSNSDAKRLIQNGGVYVNQDQAKPGAVLSGNDVIAGYVILRVGKNQQAIVSVKP